LRRILIISKYEVKQYLRSHFNVGSIIGICLVSLLLLLSPNVERVELPSAQRLYRVGFYQDNEIISWLQQSFPFRMVRYNDVIEMVKALNSEEIDSGIIIQGNMVNVMGSGTSKSDGAINRIRDEFSIINSQYIRNVIREKPELKGILIPLEIRVIEKEVDYNKIINGSIDIKRRKFLEDNQKGIQDMLLKSGSSGDEKDAKISVEIVDFGEDAETERQKLIERGGESPLELRGIVGLRKEESLLIPAELRVDFPFMNLFRNMILLAPPIILSLMFSLSLIREKVDRSLNNLFSAPVSKFDIIVGKALPYFLLIAGINVFYGFYLSSGLDALKIAIVFLSISSVILSTSLFSVVVSRSYRELTFIGSFYIFIFLFMIILPNVFAGINALALISPISNITNIEYGTSVSWWELFLSLVPYHSLTLAFLAFTLFTFDAEVLFSDWRIKDIVEHYYMQLQNAVSSKAVYSFVSVALLVPFVFLVESIFSYLILPLGNLSAFISLFVFSLIEETAKIIPYLMSRREIKPTYYAILAGTSFFLTERIFNIYLISKIYSLFGGPYLVFIAKSLVLTWGVHVVTIAFLASGLNYLNTKTQKMGLFLLVVLLHMMYNLNIIYGII
ncbi:hypothetical protein ACFLRC_04225, partial [Candidatus Altiarchaeota archaeon]